MNKLFKGIGIGAIILVILGLIIGLVVWDMGLLEQRRQPMQYVVPPPVESPFEVQDRHQDTRDWIDDRINSTPAPNNSFRPRLTEDEPPPN